MLPEKKSLETELASTDSYGANNHDKLLRKEREKAATSRNGKARSVCVCVCGLYEIKGNERGILGYTKRG